MYSSKTIHSVLYSTIYTLANGSQLVNPVNSCSENSEDGRPYDYGTDIVKMSVLSGYYGQANRSHLSLTLCIWQISRRFRLRSRLRVRCLPPIICNIHIRRILVM